MTVKRSLLLSLGVALVAMSFVGCGDKSSGGEVDAPLTTNAAPPPPKPNKPTVTPSGAGGPGGQAASPE